MSGLGRHIQAPNGFDIDEVIQTDAPINPGNSGGPLLDATGHVIGMNSQIETGSGGNGNVGIGFAIPIDTIRQKLGELKTKGTVQYAYLGVSTATVDSSFAGLLPVKSGALVQSVQKGTPAEKAGIRGGNLNSNIESGQVAVGGDIITSVDGQAVNSSEDLANDIGSKKSGQTITVGLKRANGKGGYADRTVRVTLASRPSTLPGGNNPEG